VTESARAARYVGDHRLEVTSVDVVPPGPGEVRIDVAFTGICGTDLHILHGAMDHRVRPPAVIGHEMSGRISALGDAVTDWAVGDPVTVVPLRWCGACPACRSGHSHICQHLDFVGIDSPGSMQAAWTVPADLLVRLPDTMPLQRAALVEPTAVAVHDVGRAALVAGERVVVVGAGPVGLLIACVARAADAEVLLLEVAPYRRAVAEQLGLTVLDPTEADVPAAVDDWTSGAGADASFEVSASQPGLDTALGVLGVRGRMVVVGIHAQPRQLDLHQVFWRELTILGARVYQRADFTAAVHLVAAEAVPVEALISRIEPLPAAANAFAALESGAQVMKVLVDCQAV
jgi:2-desacetyl-2-hydroxyethyl bacteriochlorophyllide A dehydrogenase